METQNKGKKCLVFSDTSEESESEQINFKISKNKENDKEQEPKILKKPKVDSQ